MKSQLLSALSISLLVLLFSRQTTLSSYTTVKAEIQSTRNALQQAYLRHGSDSILTNAGKEFHKSVAEKIIPKWYGTAWDFYGTSEIPGDGKIACGYFVSTTLRDAGFNLNRYKMAQAHSFDEVKFLCERVYKTQGLDTLQWLLLKRGEGLYILGLDNHVGYVSVEKNNCWFIHSNYLTPLCVVKEALLNSEAAASSSNFHLGEISANKMLMKKWLTNQKVLFE